MRIEDLDYELPPELIAQEPLASRDASRLMVVDVATQRVTHHGVRELGSLLPPALFVFNDTRVFAARLRGEKATGGRVELLLLRRALPDADRWFAIGRASKPFRFGQELRFADGALCARVQRVLDDGELEIELSADTGVDELLSRVGEVPLPPYIRRAPTSADTDRYQTVYARRTGAVAAPTAGLHFTKASLMELQQMGHRVAYVTLHIGPGTFRPVQADSLEDHPMHEEHYEVSEGTANAIRHAQTEGRPIVAIGTTVVRTLESAVDGEGRVRVGKGTTRLFITPPYACSLVDHLVTNFHLPRSTLLALVMALAGEDLTRRAYRAAIENRYRFYSYGDAMLIRSKAR